MPLASDITTPTPGGASNLITQFVGGTPEQALPFLTTGGRVERPDYGMSIAGGWRLKNLYGMRGRGEIQGVLDEATRTALNQYINERKAEGFKQKDANTLVKDIADGQQQVIKIDWSSGAYDLTTIFGPTTAQLAAQRKAQSQASAAEKSWLMGTVMGEELKSVATNYPTMPAELAAEVARANALKSIGKEVEAKQYATSANTAEKIKQWQAGGWLNLATAQSSGMPTSGATNMYNLVTGEYLDPTGMGFSVAPAKLQSFIDSNLPKKLANVESPGRISGLPTIDVSKGFGITTTTSTKSSGGGGGGSRSSGGGGGSSVIAPFTGSASYNPVTGTGYSSTGQGYSSAFNLGSGGTGSNVLAKAGFGQTSSNNVFTNPSTFGGSSSSSASNKISSMSGFSSSGSGFSSALGSSSSKPAPVSTSKGQSYYGGGTSAPSSASVTRNASGGYSIRL